MDSLFSTHHFRKTLVYHLGKEAGFFSEFNNMVLCILYCHKHHLNFNLYSKDATFGLHDGWTDFFLPFCKEVTGRFHSYYNVRQPINIPKELRYQMKKNLYKLLFHFDYYTYERWLDFHNRDFEKETFMINERNMDILEASQTIINQIWRYNEQTQVFVDAFAVNVALPKRYAALHIRRGDKVVEHQSEEIDIYVRKMQQYTNLKDVFVLSDDYDVIRTLKKSYPSYRFFTLVDKSERGYYHEAFVKKSSEIRNRLICKLFASVDLMSMAEYCIGTFSTNIGMYLGMRMPRGTMVGVDFDEWRIW